MHLLSFSLLHSKYSAVGRNRERQIYTTTHTCMYDPPEHLSRESAPTSAHTLAILTSKGSESLPETHAWAGRGRQAAVYHMVGGLVRNHGDQSEKKDSILTKTWLYVGWEREKKTLVCHI